MTLSTLVTIAVACVLGQAFFAGAEIAMSACGRTRLKQRADAGSWGAKAAQSTRTSQPLCRAWSINSRGCWTPE